MKDVRNKVGVGEFSPFAKMRLTKGLALDTFMYCGKEVRGPVRVIVDSMRDVVKSDLSEIDSLVREN
jgi:hypothetical protein